jgi:putative transposase
MDMVFFAIHLDQSGLEFLADTCKEMAQLVQSCAVENHTTILGDEDQMYMQIKYAVSAMSDLVVLWHRPNYNLRGIMPRFQAYRFELRPNGEQECKLRQFAGSARYVWNRALAMEKEEREKTGRKHSGYAALCRELTRWRSDRETAWLSESPVHTSQQALRDLEGAWSRHFEKLEETEVRRD